MLSHGFEHSFNPLFRGAGCVTGATQSLPGAIEHHREAVRIVENAVAVCVSRHKGHN